MVLMTMSVKVLQHSEFVQMLESEGIEFETVLEHMTVIVQELIESVRRQVK